MDDPIDSPKLHPLRATSQRRPREDTVDTSKDDEHVTSQDTYTERLFGACLLDSKGLGPQDLAGYSLRSHTVLPPATSRQSWMENEGPQSAQSAYLG